jgi:hypothetical protein
MARSSFGITAMKCKAITKICRNKITLFPIFEKNIPMNFRIPLLLASCLLFISFAGLAQGIKFNPTNKVEHVFYQYFLGHDKDKNFVLASNYDILGSYLHQRMNYAIQFSEKERIKLPTTITLPSLQKWSWSLSIK